MFVREKDVDRLYLEFAKKARAMLALMKRMEKAGKNLYTVDRKSLAELEESIRKLEILLLMNEAKMSEELGKVDERTRQAIIKAFNSMASQLERIEKAVERKERPELIEKAMEKALRGFDEKMVKFRALLEKASQRLEEQSRMMELVFRKRLDSGYLVSDRDLIKTILKMRENVRKGRWKMLPEWAKEKRKEVVKELGEKIVMATEVAVVKALVNGKATEAELLRKIPVSSYTLRKAIKRLIKEGHVKKEKSGRVSHYVLA